MELSDFEIGDVIIAKQHEILERKILLVTLIDTDNQMAVYTVDKDVEAVILKAEMVEHIVIRGMIPYLNPIDALCSPEGLLKYLEVFKSQPLSDFCEMATALYEILEKDYEYLKTFE